MLRKNELKSVVVSWLFDYQQDIMTGADYSTERVAEGIVEDILACLSPPTSKD